MVELFNQDEWQHTSNVFNMFQYLQRHGLMNRALWRRFHCACCREIWDFLRDPRSRQSVETAERFLNGQATPDDLRIAFQDAKNAEDEAWFVVQSLREPGTVTEWTWPITEAVDDAWIRYTAASAAKTCAENGLDEVMFTTIPDAAACVPAWANARNEVIKNGKDLELGELRRVVLETWKRMQNVAESHQAGILRSLVRP